MDSLRSMLLVVVLTQEKEKRGKRSKTFQNFVRFEKMKSISLDKHCSEEPLLF